MNEVVIVEQELRLSSILSLEIEVNGMNTDAFKIEGLIHKEMDASVKFWLQKLSSSLSKERKSYDILRNGLLKKYGEEFQDLKTNSIKWAVNPFIKDPEFTPPLSDINPEFDKEKDWPLIKNPSLEDLRREQLGLLKQKVKLSVPKFQLKDLFSFRTNEIYWNAGELLIYNESGEYSDLEYVEEENIK